MVRIFEDESSFFFAKEGMFFVVSSKVKTNNLELVSSLSMVY